MFFSVTGIIGVCLLIAGWFYITCPVYSFEEPKPFAGHRFYNPYQNITDDVWMKCIFHLHTKSWMGLTNGENTFGEVTDVYRKLNYNVVAISDYMRINPIKSLDFQYIPVYEHGYNVKKAHQLALGANKVVWRDYFFWQNMHHKQHVIDLLKKNSILVAVNHPSMRSSYPPDDFKYLSGYDLFEVLNGTHISETAWDVALSSGHTAWLIANDDAHTVNNPARVQREVTFVNVPAPESDEVLKCLAKGISFGVHFPRKKQSTIEEKIMEAEVVSFPVSIQVYEDTLRVVWQQMMRKIEFIGDNGKTLKTVADCNTAYYHICSNDSYVRTKLTSPEGIVYFLNPVVRCSDDEPVKHPANQINKYNTFLKHANGAIVLGTIAICAILYFFSGKRIIFLK